jgi:hypothetical protein
MTSGAVAYLAGNLKGKIACHKAGLARRRLRQGPIAPRIMVKLDCRTWPTSGGKERPLLYIAPVATFPKYTSVL